MFSSSPAVTSRPPTTGPPMPPRRPNPAHHATSGTPEYAVALSRLLRTCGANAATSAPVVTTSAPTPMPVAKRSMPKAVVVVAVCGGDRRLPMSIACTASPAVRFPASGRPQTRPRPHGPRTDPDVTFPTINER